MQKVHVVRITGNPRINGFSMKNMKAVELAYLFSSKGARTYSLDRSDACIELYGSHFSKNAVWYPLQGCRDRGIEIEYDRSSNKLVSNVPIVSDLEIALNCIRSGDIEGAVYFICGPILPGVNDEFACRLRGNLQEALAKELDQLCDSERLRLEHCLRRRQVM